MMNRLLRRWESMPARVQVVLALVVSFVFMLLLHLGPFNQPLGRALGYAAFWGVLMAAGIVVATRGEQARRRDGEGREDRR